MRRHLIIAPLCLAALLALGGCSNTAGGSGDMNPDPSASMGVNNGNIPNNAGSGTGSDNGRSIARSGSYQADQNGGVGNDLLQGAGDAMRDATGGVERAVRDVM